MAAAFTAQTFRTKVNDLFRDTHTFYNQAGASPLDEEHITVQLSLKLSEWVRSLAPAVTVGVSSYTYTLSFEPELMLNAFVGLDDRNCREQGELDQ
jgi:hypothetical protein